MLFLFPILATSPVVKNFAKHVRRHCECLYQGDAVLPDIFISHFEFLKHRCFKKHATNTGAHTYKRLAVLQLQMQTQIY